MSTHARRIWRSVVATAVVSASVLVAAPVQTAAAAASCQTLTQAEAGFSFDYVRCDAVYVGADNVSIPTSVYLPASAAPAEGLPLLVLGHGLIGTKADLDREGIYRATRGYAAMASSVPGGEEALADRARHLGAVLTQVLADFPEIDGSRIGSSGGSGGAIGSMLFRNDRSLDTRINAIAGTIGFPLDYPSQITTPYRWDVPTPLYLLNYWRDELIPYDLTRAGWRQATGPRFLLTRFVQGHSGNHPQLAGVGEADTGFNDTYVKGDPSKLDTLLHAFDGLGFSDGVFEYRLPGAPDLVVDIVDNEAKVGTGDAIEHIYRVTNNGATTSPATSLVVSRHPALTPDAVQDCAIAPNAITCAVPALAPGASANISVLTTASLTNDVARIVATIDEPGMRAAAFGETAIGTAALPFPDLSVSLEADRASFTDGATTVTYTATITNNGGVSAQNPRVVVHVDQSLTPVEHPCAVWRQDFGVLSCRLGMTLAPGASITQSYRFARTATTPASVSANARAVNGFMDARIADNEAVSVVTGNPGIPNTADVFVSTTSPTDVTVGSEITISTTFGNRGPNIARNVVLERKLDYGLEPRGYPPELCTWNPVANPAEGYRTTLTCNIGDLNPGISIPSSLTVRVTEAIGSCHLYSSVEIKTSTADVAGSTADNLGARSSLVDNGNCGRTVTGTVTYDGGAMSSGPAGMWGVGACPVGSLLPGPDCAGFKIGFADGTTGQYSLFLLNSLAYNVGAFGGPGAVLRSAVRTIPSLTSNLTGENFDVERPGVLQGTLTVDPSITGPRFVYACRGAVQMTASCGVRADVAADGSYAVDLGTSLYTVVGVVETAAGQYVTSAPHLVSVTSGQTTTASFTIGAGTAPAAANVATVPTAEGSLGNLTVSSASGTTVSNLTSAPLSTASTPPPSSGYQLETGLLAFRITGVPTGARVPVDLKFAVNPGENLAYFKLLDGMWAQHTDIQRVDALTLRVWLTDGGAGDADRTANGVIVDPGAVGRAAPEGFFSPIDMGSVLNVVKAGSTVPVKWWYGGDALNGGATAVRLTAVSCSVADSNDVLELTSTGSGFQDLGDGYWQWNWKTSASSTGCRQLSITFPDGEVVSALFQLK